MGPRAPEGERPRRRKEKRAIGSDPQVERAVVDWMTAEPKPEHLGRTTRPAGAGQARGHPPAARLRIALRETLRDPAAFTALKGRSSTTRPLRTIGDVMLGLPTKDAADFLTSHISDAGCRRRQAARLRRTRQPLRRRGQGASSRS